MVSVSDQNLAKDVSWEPPSESKKKIIQVYKNFSNSDFDHKDLMTLKYIFSNSEYDSTFDSTHLRTNLKEIKYFSGTSRSTENFQESHNAKTIITQLSDRKGKMLTSPSQSKRYDLSSLKLNKVFLTSKDGLPPNSKHSDTSTATRRRENIQSNILSFGTDRDNEDNAENGGASQAYKDLDLEYYLEKEKTHSESNHCLVKTLDFQKQEYDISSLENEKRYPREHEKCTLQSPGVDLIFDGRRNYCNSNDSDMFLKCSVSQCESTKTIITSSVQTSRVTSHEEEEGMLENMGCRSKKIPRSYPTESHFDGRLEMGTMNENVGEEHPIIIKENNRFAKYLFSNPHKNIEEENCSNSNYFETSELFKLNSNIQTNTKLSHTIFPMYNQRNIENTSACDQKTEHIGHDNTPFLENEHQRLNTSKHGIDVFIKPLPKIDARSFNTKNVIFLFDNKDKFNEVKRLKLKKPPLKYVSLKLVTIEEFFKKTFYQPVTINLTNADIEAGKSLIKHGYSLKKLIKVGNIEEHFTQP